MKEDGREEEMDLDGRGWKIDEGKMEEMVKRCMEDGKECCLSWDR